MQPLLCQDAVAEILGLFTFSVAPSLLLYSYIPITILTVVFGFLILIKDRGSIRSKLLFLLSLTFALWVINIIIQWISVRADMVMFAWQITAIFEILLPLLVLYFAYVFIEKRDLSWVTKIIGSGLYLLVIILTPTIYNVQSFDIIYCEGMNGFLLYSIYIFEFISGIGILLYGLIKTTSKKIKREEKSQIRLLSLGASVFLVVFSLTNMFGETFNTYSINLVGPIGMVVFLGLLGYMIVKFKTFNIKLIATQAFMFALVAMIGAQLFFIKLIPNFILTGLTLAASVIVGGLLIRSVKREVSQREKIEQLATNLAKSNENLKVANDKLKELDKQKTEFVSIASHQLRSPLTVIKGYTSMLLEGSFGPIENKAREAIDRVYESSFKLVNVIEDFLNITRIELGRMKYEISVFDLGQLVQTIVKDQEAHTKKQGLVIDFQDGTGNHHISADNGKVTQVISNIIDNSIKYTPASDDARIKIKVENLSDKRIASKEKVRLTVADNGVGIDPRMLKKLFEKFARADDVGKTNITGTGLGLYVAKQIVEGLNGKIWAESAGKGKGSTFFVEFPRSDKPVPVSTNSKVESYTKNDLETLQNGKK